MTWTPAIRQAKAGDIGPIHAIERLCFPPESAYSRRQLTYLSFKANSNCIVAEVDGELAGYVIVLYRRRSMFGGIETINVHPGFRGLGIGRMLLDAAETDMLRRGVRFSSLEVSTGNLVAINMYTRSGYLQKAIKKDYYHYPFMGSRDAIKMIKGLGVGVVS